MAGIRGGKVGSFKKLKASVKKGANSSYLSRIGAEGITVRFMQEPDEWIEYFEYYDETEKQFFPEVEGVTPNLSEGQRSSKRYLAAAVDVAEGKVIPLVLPKSVVSILVKKYEKYNTLIDRDYEITREGTGFDTEYDVTPEPPMKMKMARYQMIDLMAALESQIPGGDIDDEEDDDEDEDETPVRKKTRAGRSSKRVVEEDEDDDLDDEDEDDEPVRKRPAPRKKPVPKKRPRKRL